MIDASRTSFSNRKLQHPLAALSLVPLLALAGCPGTAVTDSPPDDNGGGGTTVGITAEIISPSTTFGVSVVDPPISVLYNLPESATDVEGFFIPVADAATNSIPIGDSQVTAINLLAGSGRAFNFDPQEAGVGFYRVGVTYVLAGVSLSIESSAVIQVQGSPDPIFIRPDPGDEATVSVVRGTDVEISFDARDPQGQVQWRLFLLTESEFGTIDEVAADALGTPLANGLGNVGTFTLVTDDLDPGLYYLGVSATDSGFSIADTVARGESSRIVTIPNATSSPPIIEIVP